MAGDWIKFEIATPNKPEVWEIAGALEIDPDAVVGKLLRVWAWFDEHTENGNAPSVTKTLLDRQVGVAGFCDAMIAAGWMKENNGAITLPNFERHNGKTAKNRALTAKRVAAHKERKGNEEVTHDALPREEKIVNPSTTTAESAATMREQGAAFRMTPDFQPDQESLEAHLRMMGISPDAMPPDVLGEFKSYWSAQDRKHTSAQWTQRLAKSVRYVIESRKSHHGANRKTGTGHRRSAAETFWENIFSTSP
ncbi:MAG: DnaT-like ssDNA-binding domain-containing protein [Pseudomonadota bacterium]